MKFYSGINIQFPISRLILSGEKVVETRTYPLPEKFQNKEMLLVETPGKRGKFKARIVAKIIFSNSFQYKDLKQFRGDEKKHRVEAGSEWDWKDKPKWGWIIQKVIILKNPRPLLKRPGIIYSVNLTLK